MMLLGLAACTTRPEVNPSRSATEQLLVSTAADRAAGELAFPLPPGSKVFLQTANLDDTDGKYAIAAVTDQLLRQGMLLVTDRKNADYVALLRSGALSVDKTRTLVGLESFEVPVPLSSGALGVPEIALYKSERQKGVARFTLTLLTAADGRLVALGVPQYGYAETSKNTALIFFNWETQDIYPESSPLTKSLTN
jgi:hypothetical protein